MYLPVEGVPVPSMHHWKLLQYVVDLTPGYTKTSDGDYKQQGTRIQMQGASAGHRTHLTPWPPITRTNSLLLS